MATVADILHCIETLAPRSMKESWDNVGLNCGHLDRQVTKILVALDPFAHVCQEAKDFGAQLLVTHHVLIFQPGFLTDADEQGRNALFLIENGIAHINAHTNLDVAPGGVNDCLAAKLGLSGVRVIHPSGVDEAGREWGLLRCGYTEEQSLASFLTFVKEALGCEGLRYVDGGKPVRKVAVGGGSCGSEMLEAVDAGCDTFVTSDIKYNQFWDAKDLGLNLIDAGHFYTENPVVFYLAAKIQAAFPEVAVKISETHRDCMKFL
ncbi:MAG: Nif3-like dinuclear metal center hexameric protein [Faecousia sp.]